MNPPSIILNIIAAIGGIGGITTTWYYWRRFKKRFKIVDTGSWYEVNEDKLIIKLRILFLNDSEINVSITDAKALIRLSKERIGKDIGYPQGVFEGRLVTKDIFPIVIPPHTSKKVDLDFIFESANLQLIDRCQPAYFLGWLDNVPTFISIESEKLKKWDILPLRARLLLHVDAEKVRVVDFCVSRKKDEANMDIGTFSFIDLERAKKEFWEG